MRRAFGWDESMQRREMRERQEAQRKRHRVQTTRLAIMWTVIGLVVVAIVGVGVGAATGILPVFRVAAPQTPFTPPTLPTPTPKPTPTADPTTPPPDPHASPAEQKCDSLTTMSVMAHYDDDLIFANPTIMHAINNHGCVRTVFITGGDAGKGLTYALDRETGIIDAYNVLRGVNGTWTPQQFTLDSGVPVTRYTADDNPRLSLTFLRLPDGNLRGDGFEATGYESLERLQQGTIADMHTIDTHATVTWDQLNASVSELIDAYSPSTLITLVPRESRFSAHDHSDHSTVGTLVRGAWQHAGLDPQAVKYASGYNSKDLPENVTGTDLDTKLLAFWTYAQHDSVSVCSTPQACLDLRVFGRSLPREYFLSDSDL